jgi:hypothetical protein
LFLWVSGLAICLNGLFEWVTVLFYWDCLKSNGNAVWIGLTLDIDIYSCLTEISLIFGLDWFFNLVDTYILVGSYTDRGCWLIVISDWSLDIPCFFRYVPDFY